MNSLFSKVTGYQTNPSRTYLNLPTKSTKKEKPTCMNENGKCTCTPLCDGHTTSACNINEEQELEELSAVYPSFIDPFLKAVPTLVDEKNLCHLGECNLSLRDF